MIIDCEPGPVTICFKVVSSEAAVRIFSDAQERIMSVDP